MQRSTRVVDFKPIFTRACRYNFCTELFKNFGSDFVCGAIRTVKNYRLSFKPAFTESFFRYAYKKFFI